MAIYIPDFALEGLNEAQTLEVLNALQHIYNTQSDLQGAINQSVEQFADYEIFSTPQGHTFINTGTRLMGEYTGPTVSTTETALEIAHDAYDASVLDAQGNVLYRYTTAQGAMGAEAGATSAAQATSLLSLDLGLVGAAVAPLLGVSLGVGLYESNPEFWTKLSQKLLPFCYEGTTEIPGWLDIVESAIHPGQYETHAVIDKRIVDAIQELFAEEGIGPGSSEATSPYTTVMKQPIKFVENLTITYDYTSGGSSWTRVLIFSGARFAPYLPSGNKPFIRAVVASDGAQYSKRVISYRGGEVYSDTTTTLSLTSVSAHDLSFYYADAQVLSGTVSNLSTNGEENVETDGSHFTSSISINDRKEIAYAMVYGEIQPGGIFPEGTSRWGGSSPALEAYAKSIIHYVEDPNNPGQFIPEENDGIEITLQPKNPSIPSGQPYPSADPSLEPDPNTTSNPASAISNLSNSAPGTNTNPAEEPQPEPETDPSIPNPTIAPVIPIDPPGPGGTEPPPPDEGSSPAVIPPIIPLPFSTTNDGLISVYHPTDAQLKAFASWLWVTYADPSIDKLWNNPFDGVIGLMEIYCTPTDVGTKTIRSGFLDSGVTSAIISRYTTIDCGTIFVPEYYRNYLDYSPYSKCHVYLPFIGIVELNVDDIVGHGVNITYRIDEYNGSCIAQIKVAKYTEVNGEAVTYDNIMYQFSGNCAVELPLAGGTQAAIRAGMIQAAAYGLSSVIGGIVSGVSGNIGGAVSQLGYGAANAIGSVVSAKSSVQHSGSFGSSFGALGCKTPFITISRPKQISVYNYPDLYGYPAHCAVTIGSCTGYLRVREVNVKSATASDEEKALIENLLKEGVYV